MAERAPLTVFLSSTWLDLMPERGAVLELIQRMNGFRFLGMEHFGARDESTFQTSLLEVERSDLYVGVIGGRYGSGITEAEYARARERNTPCFIYFKTNGFSLEHEPRDAEEKLRAFTHRLRESHTCVDFESPEDLALRISTDLHGFLFENHIVRGLSRLSTDFSSRVRGFVSEYVGTPQRPVPFGGRDAELAQLDGWLRDEGAPPYLLVTAGAGRGKSALLVRWTQSLVSSSDVVPLFFPVSIRFRTNLANVIFASLSSYLASLHGVHLSVDPDIALEEWRGRLSDLLLRPLPDGRRLVLVLDGLDEAADWAAGPDLLPPQLGSHARVLVSARQLAGDTGPEAWLRRLGWELETQARALVLEGLSETGLAEVLTHMGVPLSDLGRSEEFVRELHRLSEGDPLLARLYVDDLFRLAPRAPRLGVDELRAIKPGLQGYFARWWDEQRTLWDREQPLREKRVQLVMTLLANALGPLSRDDLLALAEEEHALDSWTLDDALEVLRRFIVGDGVEHGYVYSHPKLGIHMRERLTAVERRKLDERFVAWGERCVAESAAAMSGAAISPYLVQYIGGHLDRAKSPPRRYAFLLAESWHRAWRELEGGYSGYRGDLQRVRKAVERDPAAQGAVSPLAARCALCIASVDEIARSMPVELIVPLVQHRIWGRNGALRYARSIGDPRRRAEALLYLAGIEPEPSSSQVECESMEALALVASDESGDPYKAAFLERAASSLSPRVVSLALDVALGISKRSAMVQALEALLPYLAPALAPRLIDVATTLGDDDLCIRLLQRIGAVFPRLALAPSTDVAPWALGWMVLAALDAAPSERAGAMPLALELASGPLELTPTVLDFEFALALAEHLDTASRERLLARCHELIVASPAWPAKPRLLAVLSRMSPPDLAEHAMKGALLALRQLRLPAWQVAGVQALSPELDEANAAAAVEWARDLDDEAACAAALASSSLTTEQCDGLAITVCFGTETESGELVVPSNEPEWIWLRLRELSSGLSAERVMQIARVAHEDPQVVLAIHAALALPLSGDTRAVLVEAGFASISVKAVANALRWLRVTDPLDLFRAWVAATDHDSVSQLDEVLDRRHGTAEEGRRDSDARLAMATRLPSLPHTKESLERRVLALQHIGDRDAAAALFVSAFRRLTPEAAKRWNDAWSGFGQSDRAGVMVAWWSRGVDRSPALRWKLIEAFMAMGRDTYDDDVQHFLDAPEAFESPGELAALLSHLSILGDRISGATLSKLAKGIEDEDLGQHFTRLFQASLNYTPDGVAFTVSLCARVPAPAFRTAFEAACEHVASSPPVDGAHPRWPGMLALAGVLGGVPEEQRDAAGDTFWLRVAAAEPFARKAFLLDACSRFTNPEGALLDGLRATFDALEPSPGLALELLRLVDEPLFSHLKRALARWRTLPAAEELFSFRTAYDDRERVAAWITACLCAEGLSDAEIFAEMGDCGYVRATDCLYLVPNRLRPDLSRVVFAALRGENSLLEKRDVLGKILPDLHERGVRSVVAQLIRLIRSTRRAGADHELPFEAIAKESSWSFGGWVERFSERQRLILLRQLVRSERPWAAEFVAVLIERLPDDAMGAESARFLPYLVAARHRVGAIIEWATCNAGRSIEGVVRELEELEDPKVMVIAAAALSSRCDPERKHRWRQLAMSAFHALAQMESWLVDTVYAVSGADWDILGAYVPREPAPTLTQTRALPETPPPAVTPLLSLFEVASVSRTSVLQEVTRAVSDDRVAPDAIAEILDTVVEVRGWWP
jgi:hypothetical protein